MASFEQTLELLARELGVVVPDPQRALLARQLPQATRAQLVAQLTNGQTYFFRHPDQCDAFQEHLRQCNPLSVQRIWSAGCSTGCEAYSIAIMLDRARRQGKVLGTDISAQRLAEAEAAVYPESRVLRLRPADRDKYFLLSGDDRWRVKPHIASQVSFAEENLIAQPGRFGPGMSRRWDAIFCRNVLIYFDEARARDILGRMVARLETDGLLVLGYPEAFFGLQHPELALVASRTAIFRKVAKAQVASLVVPHPTITMAPRPGSFQEGLRLHAMGALEEARYQFRQAEEDEPALSLVHYFFARLHDELGERSQAVASLRKFFETYRDDDPVVLEFTRRNGLSLSQLRLAATRLRERLDRSGHAVGRVEAERD